MELDLENKGSQERWRCQFILRKIPNQTEALGSWSRKAFAGLAVDTPIFPVPRVVRTSPDLHPGGAVRRIAVSVGSVALTPGRQDPKDSCASVALGRSPNKP